MNRTTKINILAYASEPDKNYKYEGDIVDYKGKRYFVSLAEERVEFIGIIKEDESRLFTILRIVPNNTISMRLKHLQLLSRVGKKQPV